MYILIRNRLKELGIQYPHFNSFINSFISRTKNNGNKPIEELLVKGDRVITHLRSRILNEGLLEYKCQICGQDPWWNGKEMALHLDHIDGDSTNNVITNLRFVCSNCDQTLWSWGSKRLKGTHRKDKLLDSAKSMVFPRYIESNSSKHGPVYVYKYDNSLERMNC